MSFLSPKKIILLGFIIILLIAIPLTLYLVQKQQQTKGNAQAATSLSFVPSSTNTSVGQTVSFDISLDPGGINQVSFVKLIIDYDPTKLSTAGAGLVPNTSVLPTTLQEPVYGPGTISTTLSVGADPTKVIQTKTTIATVTFQALTQTDPNIPTKITFDNQTLILSIASTEQYNENILSTTTPASVAIAAAALTPTPTSAPATPTSTPTSALTPTPVSSVSSIPVPPSSQPPPTCTNLTLDKSSTGAAPYPLTLTATGGSSGGTINKVTFIFGDGTTQDITQGGGIGTNSVSVQAAHTYDNPGSFTAAATLTDNTGAVSNTSSCTQNITVTSQIASSQTSTVTPTPTLAPTGPGNKIIGIGVLGAAISIIGGLLFFAL